ncbi:META domain-containing protein [Mycobacteroides saopaulense]|uniref:DUF306 domain-containing protein n=1 Tax=Mycobacteroides saopaulense TaxID=1578165 RepID=A0ABX3BVJ6_9MYCO|nr:META domain-containing protein [Mycobacteroides saopaulense]OHT88111.1 hypothetical protein BKG68_09180 [Mycobacteroides saopaulense]OHU06452.1 hypothetical protein BKG73_23325 [Mycobacteroides saopaulense]
MKFAERTFLRTFTFLAALIGATFVLVIVTQSQATADPHPGLTDTRWILTAETVDGVTTPYTGAEAFVELHGGAADSPEAENVLTLSGKDGCNNMTATVTPQPGTNRLSFGGVASTRMFCPPPTAEQQFARVFSGDRDYRVLDGVLMVTDPATSDNWTFHAQRGR